MTRKKVKLEYITNDSARKATFKKRKNGLMKKVSELSTLCGIDACAIIYSPYESEPDVWPCPAGAQRVISQFTMVPQIEQSKKMLNQETFLRQRITKGNGQLKKQTKDNHEKEISQVISRCLIGQGFQDLSMIDFSDLSWLIDQYLQDINRVLIGPATNEVEPVEDYRVQPQVLTTGVTGAAAIGDPGMMRSMESHNHHQVQVADQTMNMNMNMDHMMEPKQPWFMEELMNMNVQPPQDNPVFRPVDDLMQPYGDPNHNDMWSRAFFP